MNKLQKPLQELENKLQTITTKKSHLSTLTSELQSQENQMKLQIIKVFSKLRQFLDKEENARLAALKDEQNRNIERIMEKIREVDRLHTFLSERIKTIKDDLRCNESLFLQKFKDTEARLNITLPDPQVNLVSGIDVAKHTGNLSFSIWEKMKSICPKDPQILGRRTKILYVGGSSNLTSMPSLGVNLLNSQSSLVTSNQLGSTIPAFGHGGLGTFGSGSC